MFRSFSLYSSLHFIGGNNIYKKIKILGNVTWQRKIGSAIFYMCFFLGGSSQNETLQNVTNSSSVYTTNKENWFYLMNIRAKPAIKSKFLSI